MKLQEESRFNSSGAVTSFANNILGVATTILDMAHAYNRSDPG